MLAQPWRIEFFGGLKVRQGDMALTRFGTYKTGALLAYLAYFPQRAHFREMLADLFWPEADPAAGRKSLGVALVALRRMLEPPGTPANSVILADRTQVACNSDAFTSDVADFLVLLKPLASPAFQGSGKGDRTARLIQAVSLYSGELLPGYYEDWITAERERLALEQFAALRALSRQSEAEAPDRALAYALQAVRIQTFDEDARYDLMRLFALVGRPAEARRHYRDWERMLHEELDERPSPRLRQFLRSLELEASPDVALHQETIPRFPSLPTSPAVSFPPLSPSAAPSRLPVPLSRFFGRQQEIEHLCKMLEAPDLRLLTLTGPGGTGKTRLAMEVGRRWGDQAAVSPVFVPLAEVTEAALLGNALAAALGASLTPELQPLEQAIALLKEQPTLLILDNFEQIAEEGVLLVETLLQRAPEVKLLVTSRQCLHGEGEQEIALPPLPIPTIGGTPERLMEFACVQLFVDRAQKVAPDFQLTARNAADMAALCHRLEGIPLAIELAAAWARTLTLTQILEHLSRRFELLIARRKGASPRQHSLRATIEWSYRLLSPNLRRLFAGLSVFRGGFTLQAAQAVCLLQESENSSEATEAGPFTLDALTALQERSLITAREDGTAMRYHLLETLREFGADQLSPSDRHQLLSRHRDYFLSLVETAQKGFRRAEERVVLDQVETEYDNLRAALSFCLDENQGAEAALRLTAALLHFWWARGYLTEGRERFQDALTHPGAQTHTRLRADVLSGAGDLANMQGDYAAALAFYEESLMLWQELGEKQGIANAFSNLGTVAKNQDNYAAARSFQEASLAIWQELGEKQGIANTLGNLGIVAKNQGDFASARTMQEATLAIRRELEDKIGMAASINNLGVIAEQEGDYPAARALHEQSLALHKEMKNRRGIAIALNGLGDVAQYQGDYPAARSFYEESLAIRRELMDRQGIANCLSGLGHLALADGDSCAAHRLFMESLAIRRDVRNKQGSASSLFSFAALSLQRQPERAVRLYAAMMALRDSIGAPLVPRQRQEADANLAQLRSRLDAAAFDASWQSGSALSWEEAVAEALIAPPHDGA